MHFSLLPPKPNLSVEGIECRGESQKYTLHINFPNFLAIQSKSITIIKMRYTNVSKDIPDSISVFTWQRVETLFSFNVLNSISPCMVIHSTMLMSTVCANWLHEGKGKFVFKLTEKYRSKRNKRTN